MTLWTGAVSGFWISILEKQNWFHVILSNNTCVVDVKMDGSVHEGKSSFEMLGLTFSSKFDCGSNIISIAKTVSKKTGALICSRNFFLLRLLCIPINLPYGHAWNTVVMSRLVLLIATWNC